MKHLDDDAMKLLEAGDAVARAHFAAHLSASCEECEGYLMTVEGPAMLGGAADAALAMRAADARAPLDEEGFRRVRRALKPPRRRSISPGWRVRAVAMASTAAAVVGVAILMFSRPLSENSAIDSPPAGVKGGAGLTLELQAAHQIADGTLQAVERGAVLAPTGALILRYYATDRGGAWLFAKRGDRVESLGAFALEPGLHPLTLQNGAIASLPLEEEAGEVVLILVAAVGRIPTLDDARKAVEDRGSSPLAVTHLELRVEASRR
jgi:hypothetical protein